MTQKSRKIRAIAAGGAVLGLGAAITLAAWSDSEFAIGDFTTGSFDIQSSDGVTEFASSSEGTPLPLTFTGADNLAPEVPVYNAYQLKNAGTADAYVNYTQQAAAEIDLLEVELRTVADATCDATAFAAGTLVTPDVTGEFVLAPQAQGNYCFQVVLPGGVATNDSATGEIVWTFEANQEAQNV